MDLFFIWAEKPRRHSDRQQRIAAENAFYETHAGSPAIPKTVWWARTKAHLSEVSGSTRADPARGDQPPSARQDCQETACKATVAWSALWHGHRTGKV